MRLDGKNIGKSYGSGQWLFRHIDFHLESGETAGLIGPSGCGKSTLSRILAGYERPDEGEVLLDGRPVPERGFRPVQLVFQHPERAVNPRWTVGRTLSEAVEPLPELLDALGIKSSWLSRWPGELSGGELQRICIARALAPQTKLLIADEMTTMLDPVSQAQIWHTVLGLAAERGMGLLVVSHDRSLVNRICDRVIDMTEL
ncbi:ABC transporter ATP-binding protein [Paenibacillus tarimensis]